MPNEKNKQADYALLAINDSNFDEENEEKRPAKISNWVVLLGNHSSAKAVIDCLSIQDIKTFNILSKASHAFINTILAPTLQQVDAMFEQRLKKTKTELRALRRKADFAKALDAARTAEEYSVTQKYTVIWEPREFYMSQQLNDAADDSEKQSQIIKTVNEDFLQYHSTESRTYKMQCAKGVGFTSLGSGLLAGGIALFRYGWHTASLSYAESSNYQVAAVIMMLAGGAFALSGSCTSYLQYRSRNKLAKMTKAIQQLKMYDQGSRITFFDNSDHNANLLSNAPKAAAEITRARILAGEEKTPEFSVEEKEQNQKPGGPR